MAKTNTEGVQLAGQLSEWAKKYGCENGVTRSLSESLASSRDLYKWADLNPFDYLPHPIYRRDEKRLRLIERLTILRNVLVFSPVALTWAAVSEATSAFEKYTSENAGIK